MRPNSIALALSFIFLAGCGGGSTTPPIAPQTWNVTAGTSASQEAFQGLEFYPNAITIDAGDTVVWHFPAGEPHTVTFLGGSVTTPPAPSSPLAHAPAGGTTYDGTAFTNSGFVLLGKTYSLTFPKAGTYPYYCLLHKGMAGTIVVQPAGKPYPEPQVAYDAQAGAAMAVDLTSAAASLAQFPYLPGGAHLAAGISLGLNTGHAKSSVLRFLDGPSLSQSTVTVPVGTTITWTNLSSNLPHTVTFGPVGHPFPTLVPFSPPMGGSTYDGTTLVNSGVLLPGRSYSLTFTAAGTYTAHCLFHDDTQGMISTVIVQ